MRYDIMQYSTWVRSDAWRAAGCGDCTTRRNVGALGTAESRPGVSCAAAALADPPANTTPSLHFYPFCTLDTTRQTLLFSDRLRPRNIESPPVLTDVAVDATTIIRDVGALRKLRRDTFFPLTPRLLTEREQRTQRP